MEGIMTFGKSMVVLDLQVLQAKDNILYQPKQNTLA
jgi:hypothetical protein